MILYLKYVASLLLKKLLVTFVIRNLHAVQSAFGQGEYGRHQFQTGPDDSNQGSHSNSLPIEHFLTRLAWCSFVKRFLSLLIVYHVTIIIITIIGLGLGCLLNIQILL